MEVKERRPPPPKPVTRGQSLLDIWRSGAEGTSRDHPTCTSPPPTLFDNTPSTAATPPASTPPATPASGGRTRTMPRHSITEGFLAEFVAHLQTLAGGKKTPTVAQEIATDVAKFLFFANPEAAEPDNLLKRVLLTRFITTLEEKGIGSSGIRTKLVRLRLAIQFFMITQEGEAEEDFIIRRAEQATNFLETVRGCVALERAREDRQRLDEFRPPSLDGVNEFLSSSWLSTKVALLGGRLQSGGQATTAELEEAQLIVMGRLMYRCVQHIHCTCTCTCTRTQSTGT